jgi:GH24 family phage-related lysozyme (muramidase)
MGGQSTAAGRMISAIRSHVVISERLVAAVKRYEPFHAEAWQDSIGRWRIGYGRKQGLYRDQSTSEEIEDRILRRMLDDTGVIVMNLVGHAITQGQFEALVDLTYDLSTDWFHHSELRRLLNAGDTLAAAAEFSRLPGEKERRAEERKRFEEQET